MDISVIKSNETNGQYGIHITNDGPKQMIEFLNLRCPFCRQWFNESQQLLAKAVEEGKLERVIKLTDRSKESLQRGNVMHRFVTDDDPEKALEDITKIFASQDEWGNLSLKEVADYARDTLHLTEHHHLDIAEEIVEETKRANIKFVPTIIVEDHIFDENIDLETLKSYINA
ncbi:MAG TPA: thioredoxin domain-containing protein [Tetragenococcus sp.]|nr:thioredoxin domain-containing protein [Tetragenococcus sp.]